MRELCKIILAAVIVTVIAGCSSMSIRTDYDHDVDFAGYRTFDFLPKSRPMAQSGPLLNPFMEKRIEEAIETELTAKGYSKDSGGRPNFLIAIHAGARNRVNVTDFGYHYGPRGRWGRRHLEVNTYKEGTLILDFVDPKLEQLIWRGWAVGALANPDKVEEQIVETVKKILEEFPPE
jgi:hypothetical protein